MTAFAVLLQLGSVGAQAVDPRFEQNPALAKVRARDPMAADRLLDALDFIVRHPLRGDQAGEPIDPAYRDLLRENPLLQEAYRINPKAVLLQLGEIVKIGGGR